MANDVKMGVGFIIPATAVVGFFISLILGEFLLSIIISITGILVWFLYMMVMGSGIPRQTGNMIILFGVLLSIGVFASFGVKQNMFGGVDLQTNGSMFSLITLFFSILTGMSFRGNIVSNEQAPIKSALSDSDKDLVMNVIKETQANKSGSEDPKIIVVKQEAKKEEIEPGIKDSSQVTSIPIDPYGMANNPYFAYPPDYGQGDYEDDYEDDDYEDDYEEGDYEDDYEDDDYEGDEKK
jgi:hypothetical protein